MSAGTVLVTGASGYIARHILRVLLDDGWNVRASVCSADKAPRTRAAVGAAVADADSALARLTFVELDLGRDAGWDRALDGVDALVHTASPFPLNAPKDAAELIRPAIAIREKVEYLLASGRYG